MSDPHARWPAACPDCRAPLGSLAGSSLRCAACGASWSARDGIWDFVVDHHRARIDAFLHDYTTIRHAEGRGWSDEAAYRALPIVDPSDPLAWQWSIRARSWHHLRRQLIARLPAGRLVLDLGAGVGWMSHRLAEAGHHPLAVDLTVDDLDGLGAARHYPASWPRVRAEFDRLPLADGCADVAIFNASFHYCVDPVVTLAECRRVLTPGGVIVIVDTPVYRRAESGQQMAADRHADFERRFGTRSDTTPSIEFVTDDVIAELGRRCGIGWTSSQAWYGWRWWWRPWRAKLQRRREPSRFLLLEGRATHD